MPRLGNNLLIYIMSVAAFIMLWHFLALYYFNPLLIPPPLNVFEYGYGMLEDGELFPHIWISISRVLIGYAIGCGFGILIGVSIGLSRLLNDFVDPPMQFVRSITPVAIVPLAIHAFGLGETSKYFVIFYGSFIPVVLNTSSGIASVPKIRVRAAQCLGASPADVVRYVMLPSSWPFVLTGLRLALGFAFMGVVAAEMIAADSGVGFLIMQSRNMLLPEQMFTGLFLLGLVGVVTDRAFLFAINRIMRRYMVLIYAESGFRGV